MHGYGVDLPPAPPGAEAGGRRRRGAEGLLLGLLLGRLLPWAAYHVLDADALRHRVELSLPRVACAAKNTPSTA